jgi:hypothetical protein
MFVTSNDSFRRPGTPLSARKFESPMSSTFIFKSVMMIMMLLRWQRVDISKGGG